MGYQIRSNHKVLKILRERQIWSETIPRKSVRILFFRRWNEYLDTICYMKQDMKKYFLLSFQTNLHNSKLLL